MGRPRGCWNWSEDVKVVADKKLPSELVALIHHVELSEAGWWEKAVRNLALATIWLHGGPLTTSDLKHRLATEFGVKVTSAEMSAITSSLAEQVIVVERDEGWVLSAEGSKVVEGEIGKAGEIDDAAK